MVTINTLGKVIIRREGIAAAATAAAARRPRSREKLIIILIIQYYNERSYCWFSYLILFLLCNHRVAPRNPAPRTWRTKCGNSSTLPFCKRICGSIPVLSRSGS